MLRCTCFLVYSFILVFVLYCLCRVLTPRISAPVIFNKFCSTLPLQLSFAAHVYAVVLGSPNDLNSFGVRISGVKAIFTECYGFEHFLTSNMPINPRTINSSFRTCIDLVLANIYIHI